LVLKLPCPHTVIPLASGLNNTYWP
jgi:hypothetical protein